MPDCHTIKAVAGYSLICTLSNISVIINMFDDVSFPEKEIDNGKVKSGCLLPCIDG